MALISVKEVSLTKDVLEEIRKIDLEFYPNIGAIDWYLARYRPWHTAFLALDGEKIIGYLAAMPVQKELYDAIVNGVLVDDLGVNPNMYLQESAYYYAGSIVIRKEYWGQHISRRLIDLFFSKYADKKICALTVSKAGYHLASRYFTLAKQISENVGVFVYGA